MIDLLLHFSSLFLLMLVTGVFWGPWLALHRTLDVFDKAELIHLTKTLATNLGPPMQFMLPACLALMGTSLWRYPLANLPGFSLIVIAIVLLTVSLLISVLVELPIVNRIKQWTANTTPSNWEAIRNRWVTFHVLRMGTALLSLGCFLLAILRVVDTFD